MPKTHQTYGGNIRGTNKKGRKDWGEESKTRHTKTMSKGLGKRGKGKGLVFRRPYVKTERKNGSRVNDSVSKTRAFRCQKGEGGIIEES